MYATAASQRCIATGVDTESYVQFLESVMGKMRKAFPPARRRSTSSRSGASLAGHGSNPISAGFPPDPDSGAGTTPPDVNADAPPILSPVDSGSLPAEVAFDGGSEPAMRVIAEARGRIAEYYSQNLSCLDIYTKECKIFGVEPMSNTQLHLPINRGSLNISALRFNSLDLTSIRPFLVLMLMNSNLKFVFLKGSPVLHILSSHSLFLTTTLYLQDTPTPTLTISPQLPTYTPRRRDNSYRCDLEPPYVQHTALTMNFTGTTQAIADLGG